MTSNKTFTPEGESTLNSSTDISLSLVTMPREIIIHILGFLDTLNIFRTECVCKYLQSLASAAYGASYGPGPLHRKCDPIDFRALAIEQFQFVLSGEAEDCSPDKQSSMLLDDYYSCSDEALYDTATDATTTTTTTTATATVN
jgi:hypothetical protein